MPFAIRSMLKRTSVIKAGFAATVLAFGPGIGANAQQAAADEVTVAVDRGAYLAGRFAAMHEDFLGAAPYLARALEADPTNAPLASDALSAFIGADNRDAAFALAQAITGATRTSQLANTVTLASAAIDGNWRGMFEQLEAGRSAGPLIDGLARGWGHLGLGETADAISAFDEMVENPPSRVIGQFHKGLALAMVGDFEGADAALSQPAADGVPMTGPAVLALAEVRSQLGDNPGAIALIDGFFTSNMPHEAQALRDRLEAGDAIPFTRVRSPAQGMAEAYYAVAQIAAQGDDAFVSLLYARLTTWIDPVNDGAQFSTARLLADMGNMVLAEQAYAAVAADSPSSDAAQMGRAMLLADNARTDEALPLVEDLIAAQPENAGYHAVLAAMLRDLDRPADSVTAYSAAIERTPPANRWPLYFSRAVTHHALRDMPSTEADLRAALEQAPDQPIILNYLGYLLIDRNEKLDEGLDMIERAIAATPDNGAVVDSLGWAYFRLGRYADAVVQLERAVLLEPVEYEINDHLGDAYWMVGRKREARFQWQRALSFATGPNAPEGIEPEVIEAIRAKLADGLTAPATAGESDG